MLEDSYQPEFADPEFEQILAEVESSLAALKERYTNIQEARQHQAQLQQRLEEIQDNPQFEQELQQIQRQLQELEIALESALLSDRQMRKLFGEALKNSLLGEIFWQIVRFGGLGVIIGWLLKSWVNG
jgi:tRNA U34 5-carboxymethylaminomethyl modifying GTPase MnmE/TrmE